MVKNLILFGQLSASHGYESLFHEALAFNVSHSLWSATQKKRRFMMKPMVSLALSAHLLYDYAEQYMI